MSVQCSIIAFAISDDHKDNIPRSSVMLQVKDMAPQHESSLIRAQSRDIRAAMVATQPVHNLVNYD